MFFHCNCHTDRTSRTTHKPNMIYLNLWSNHFARSTPVCVEVAHQKLVLVFLQDFRELILSKEPDKESSSDKDFSFFPLFLFAKFGKARYTGTLWRGTGTLLGFTFFFFFFSFGCALLRAEALLKPCRCHFYLCLGVSAFHFEMAQKDFSAF